MTRREHIDTVAAFARQYVNDPNERTHDRDELIKNAASVVLGKNQTTCSSCLLDFATELYRLSKMEESKYEMRFGALLEVFSRADLVMTVHNTTDDLAELHLGLKPHEIVYFSEFPKDENGEFVGVTAQRLAELKAKFELATVYETEVQPEEPTTKVELIGKGGKKVSKK